MTYIQLMTKSHFINHVQSFYMKTKNIFSGIGFAFLLMLFCNASYSETRKLTIDEAVAISVANNHDAQAARLNIKKADAAIDEAAGYAFPTLNVSGNYTYNVLSPVFFLPGMFFPGGNPNEFIPVKISADNSFQAGATVTQILFNAQVFQGISTSKTYHKGSVEQFKGTISKTILGTQKAFYGVLLSHEYLETMNLLLKNSQENLSTIEAMYNEGFIAEFDKIRAEVGVENIRPLVMQAETQLVNALNGLKVSMGFDVKDSIDVVGRLEMPADTTIPDENSAVNDVELTNYDLATLRYMKSVNEDIITIRKGEFFPTLAAFGNYNYQGQWNSPSLMQTAKSSMVGLNLSMNLFQGFQSNARVQQAKIDYQTTDEKYRQLKDVMIMQVKNAILQLKVAKKRIQAQQSNVSQAERGYEIAKIRYKEGVGNLIEINDADLALFQARMNKAQAIFDFNSAKADYNNLLGKVEPKYFSESIK